MNDAEYARFKRAAEYYRIDPDFRLRAAEDPAGALKVLSFTPGDPELALQGLADVASGCTTGGEANPYIAEFTRRNRAVSGYVARAHSQEAFARGEYFRFADTTRNRCRMESRLIRLHDNIRYFPLCFELSTGCTVQCPFCGLNAQRWQADYRYTPENAALWREVLRSAAELLGPVAGTSPCYLATEPLDNPDYESFLADFYAVTGQLPQTTTAIAERDPERIRRLMRQIGGERLRREASLRFSIRTKAQFYRIAELYTPEELADVELLANNPESTDNYAASGRARTGGSGKPAGLPYSICCVAGVKVNMTERSLQFLEPEIPDRDFPLGIRVRETLHFDSAADFRRKLAYLMDTWAVGLLPADRPVALNRNCRVKQEDDTILFLGDGVGYRISGNAYTRQAVRLMEKGCAPIRIREGTGLPQSLQQAFFALLNNLYIRGYLRLAPDLAGNSRCKKLPEATCQNDAETVQ